MPELLQAWGADRVELRPRISEQSGAVRAPIRAAAPIPVAAVGMITEAAQAEQVLVDGSADAVFLGRARLRESLWPLKAATELGAELHWPTPHRSAKYRGSIP